MRASQRCVCLDDIRLSHAFVCGVAWHGGSHGFSTSHRRTRTSTLSRWRELMWLCVIMVFTEWSTLRKQCRHGFPEYGSLGEITGVGPIWHESFPWTSWPLANRQVTEGGLFSVSDSSDLFRNVCQCPYLKVTCMCRHKYGHGCKPHFISFSHVRYSRHAVTMAKKDVFRGSALSDQSRSVHWKQTEWYYQCTTQLTNWTFSMHH